MAQTPKINKSQKVFLKSFMDSFLSLQEQYYNPQDVDSYWDGLVADALELIDQFKTEDPRQNNLCEAMVMAFVRSRE